MIRSLILLAGLLLGTATARAETITVTHWGGQFYGAPYAVAMDKGYFKAHGVDITGILTAPGGGSAVRNTLAGGIPVGEVSLAAAVQAINAGQKLVIVGGGAQSVGDQLWIAKRGTPLHSIKDLVGKKVAFTSPGSVSNMVILMALKSAGLTPQQVTLVPAGDVGACLAAVVNGAVDAAFTDETIYKKNGGAVQPVFFVKDVMPPQMEQTVVITTVEFAKDHPDTVAGILLARSEGLAYLTAHPDEAAGITAAAYNNPDKTAYVETFKDLLSIGYWSDGTLNREGMNRMLEGLRITGQLKSDVDWSKLVNTAFLPASLRNF